MEHLFSMRRKPLKCEPPHFERATDLEIVRPICTISCGNIIAFSSPTELTDQECDTWGGHVYVCDLETPWDAHKVISTTHAVSALEWDGEGKQLLVATTEGNVMVLGQKEYLINEWTTLYTTTFPGEHIIKGCFFHNGRRFVLLDKKADAPITERIQALRPAPTLEGYGGTACPGVCIVSATGLIGCLAPSRADGRPDARDGLLAKATESLRAHRLTVTQASIVHSNGAILVACVCVSPGGVGPGAASVRCVRLTVAHRTPREPRSMAPALALSLTPLPTLVCNSVPTSLAWYLNDECDSILVYGSSLALWKLTERQHLPHKMLPKEKALPPYITKVWQQAGAWGGVGAGDGGAGRVCSARSAPPTAAGPAPAPAPAVPAPSAAATAPLAILATTNALHVVGRGTHTYLYSRAPPLRAGSGAEGGAASPPKKAKYGRSGSEAATPAHGPVLCSVEVSWLGGVVVAIDTLAQLHVYTYTHTDIPTPTAVQQATTLLEYAIVSGTDYLDALLTLKPNIIEAVYERLTETFQRQPSQFQQYYYHSWLKTRIALCRLIPTATCTVSGLTCVLTLWGTWCAVLPTLRHFDSQHALDHADHEKVIMTLESKLELSPEAAVLSALRRPLTRVLDIAATALAAAADTSAAHRHHGYELWADPVAISLLRKLLLVARAAGLRDAPLSATLARLHQPAKPELIEECSAVASAWSARVWEVYGRSGVSVPPLAERPLLCTYLVPPERLRSAPEPPPCAATDGTPTSDMDSIRYMYLGACRSWRGCSRCGARALPHGAPQRAALQRAHDARFLPACRCGGKWTLFRERLLQD